MVLTWGTCAKLDVDANVFARPFAVCTKARAGTVEVCVAV